MDIRFALERGSKLSEMQIREIEAARNMPYVEEEDSPEIDPEKNPELYEGFLRALGDRNRRMAK